MTELDARYARSGYRVRLADGKWHDVLNYALIDPKINKLGYAVVWLRPLTTERGAEDKAAMPHDGAKADRVLSFIR